MNRAEASLSIRTNQFRSIGSGIDANRRINSSYLAPTATGTDGVFIWRRPSKLSGNEYRNRPINPRPRNEGLLAIALNTSG
jgi:hypothetical protein